MQSALAACTALPYTFAHDRPFHSPSGLRLLYEDDSPRHLKQDLAERVRGILAALAMAETMDGFIR
ncbi:MAG: hypothetical protein OXH79_16030 [Boseongicola sp.]|nr:hypothetical protein [Boseongicola sp.]